MARAVFIPPGRVTPSGSPFGDPASLLSNPIGLRKGGAKYQKASVRSKTPWITPDPAQPWSDVGVQSEAQNPSSGLSVTAASSGSVADEREDEDRGGGPATGILDLPVAFGACRSDALADML
jgi:hypothetical protein